MTYLVGIDGGGTGCRAVLSDGSGRILGSGKSGPANIMSRFDGARTNIVDAASQAIASAGLAADTLAEVSAFLGLAGANNPERVARMTQSLPFKACRIVTDAHISLQGAIGDGDGAAAIIGTGSVFINRIDDVFRTIGGWGFMIGDLGSGAWLGRALLQDTLLAHDGIHQASDLTRHVLARFDNTPQSLVEYAQGAEPRDFAEFAPLIFECLAKNDPAARRIVAVAVAHIEDAAEAIMVPASPGLCLLGGLGDIYAPLLNEKNRALIRPPRNDAVSGAVSLAVKHFGSGSH